MPTRNRFASLDDPETSRRADDEPVTLTTGFLEVSSTSKTQRPPSKPVSLTTGVVEISEPAAELGARERRPYGGIAETKESFHRPAATRPAASPYTSNAQELLQDDPLINAIIESSRAQVDSMAAEIIQWKRKVDEKDAELAYLRDATRRLLAERQEFDDQIKAIRNIVEVKPEVRELPTLRQDLPPFNSKTQDKAEPKPASTNVKPETKSNGDKTQAPNNKPAVNPYSSTTSDDPKPKRAPQRYYKPRKPNQLRTEPRPRRQKTIFDLPKEAISRIVFHLSPPPPNPLLRSDPVRETSPLFDEVWHQDLEHWAGTCVRFSRILRGNYRWRVCRFDDEDPIAWHERVERMPHRIRPLVQALEFVRSDSEIGYEISTDRDDYDDYARMFPNLRAIRHHGQIKLLRTTNNLSDWNYDHPLEVVDIVHSTSLVGDNDLKPDAKATPLNTLVLRDGLALPSDMVYADLKPYRRAKPDAIWLTYALRHFTGIENLVLHLQLKDNDGPGLASEKTPLQILRREEWPALKRVEVRFAMPYAYGSRDVCMLNGFQDLFKRFSPNIERVVLIVTLESASEIKRKVVRYGRQNRPAHLTYWGIVKTHYIPPVDRLEKFAVRLAKDLPRFTAFEFRVEDEKVDREPLVRYTAYVKELERVLQKVYKHRMPKGYPDVAGFWEEPKPEWLWR